MIPWRTKCVTMIQKATINGLVCPFISDGSHYYKPENHLVLFIDLITAPFEPTTPDTISLSNGAVTFSKRQAIEENSWEGYHKDPAKEATRFCLDIRGCNVDTYPVIRPLEGPFERLLSFSGGDLDLDETTAESLDSWIAALSAGF